MIYIVGWSALAPLFRKTENMYFVHIYSNSECCARMLLKKESKFTNGLLESAFENVTFILSFVLLKMLVLEYDS